MPSQLSSRSSLAPQQFQLLSALEQGLQKLQASLLIPDAFEIERQCSAQMKICRDFTALRASAPAALPSAPGLSPQLQALRQRVLHLNRVNKAIIVRSRRSLEIFSCLLASLAATYNLPRPALNKAPISGAR